MATEPPPEAISLPDPPTDDEFGAMDSGGDSDSSSEASSSPKVVAPCKTQLPESMQEAMFVPPEGFGPDHLFQKMGTKSGVNYAHCPFEQFTPQQKSAIHLLKILKGLPLSLFDEIQKLRYKSHIDYRDTMDNGCAPPMRAKAIKQIKEIYGFQSLDHEPRPTILPLTGKQVKLIVFSLW